MLYFIKSIKGTLFVLATKGSQLDLELPHAGILQPTIINNYQRFYNVKSLNPCPLRLLSIGGIWTLSSVCLCITSHCIAKKIPWLPSSQSDGVLTTLEWSALRTDTQPFDVGSTPNQAKWSQFTNTRLFTMWKNRFSNSRLFNFTGYSECSGNVLELGREKALGSVFAA